MESSIERQKDCVDVDHSSIKKEKEKEEETP